MVSWIKMKKKPAFLTASILICLSFPLRGGDWPQFLGSYRNGSTQGETLLAEFADNEPQIIWKHKLGSGFSGPVVSEGRVFIFHRLGNKAVLDALSTNNGKVQWSFQYITDYTDDFGFDNGPRAVPLVHERKVYLLGAEGIAHCINAETGKSIWSFNLQEKLNSKKGFFGRACSPMIIDNSLILQVGGKAAGIIGLDTETGDLKWKATDHEAGYASPVEATIAGQKIAVCFTREGIVCINPADGKVLIEHAHRSSMNASVNAASPLMVSRDRVFISACYGVGATLWKIVPEKNRLEPVWKTNQKLDCHYATPVHFNGHLIGFHGRQETGTELRCIDALTGDVKWQSGRMPAGSVTLAGKTLIIVSERGELILAKANENSFKPAARGQILGADTRAMPALSNGHLFARDKRQLVCVKINP
jgi:outer membrane protein assembly factor BamB